jgi:hypothetical protein
MVSHDPLHWFDELSREREGVPEVSLTLFQELVVFLAHQQLLETQHGTVVVGAVGGVELETILL